MSLLGLVRSIYLEGETATVDAGGLQLVFRDGALYLDRSSARAAELDVVLDAATGQAGAGRDAALRAALEQVAADIAGRRSRRHDGASADLSTTIGPLPTAHLLAALAVHGCGERELLRRLGGEKTILERDPQGPAVEDLPASSAEVAPMLDRLAKPQSVLALIGPEGAGRVEALRTLARLEALALIRRAGGDGQPSAARLGGSARFAAAIAADLEREPLTLAADAHRAEVVELWRSLDGQDHYRLLGIGREADEQAVHRAFSERARLVHPSHAARLGFAGRDAMFEVLFERAVEAYRTLSSPDRRLAYHRELDLRPEVEVDERQRGEEKRKLAHSCYRHGVRLLAANETSTAVDVLKEAVRLDPQAEYLGALAQAQAKNPAWRRHALDSYRRAVRKAPDDAGLRVGLGALFEALERPQEAIEAYRAALAAMPDNAEAKIALDRLGAASRGGGLRGLLGRRGTAGEAKP